MGAASGSQRRFTTSCGLAAGAPALLITTRAALPALEALHMETAGTTCLPGRRDVSQGSGGR